MAPTDDHNMSVAWRSWGVNLNRVARTHSIRYDVSYTERHSYIQLRHPCDNTNPNAFRPPQYA